MRSVSAAFTTQLEADNVALIRLASIQTSTPIRRAFWNDDVTWGGNTYTADGGGFSRIEQDLKLTRPEFEMTLQNVADASDDSALPWSDYDLESLNGTEVITYIVEESLLADSDAVITEQRWHISGATLDHESVRFRLLAPFDSLAIKVPRLPLGAKTCWWKYKQGPCTSTSGYVSCNKTIQDCLKRFPEGAALPFGPSYPFMSKVSRVR